MPSIATLRESLTLQAHDAPVQSIAFGTSRALMATGDVKRLAKVWRSGRPAESFDLSSRQDKIRPTERIRGLCFSPDGRSLYTACGDMFEAHDLEAGEVAWAYRPPRSFGFLIMSPIAVAVSGKGDIAVATDAGRVTVWTPAGALKAHWGDNDSPRHLAFAGEDRLVGTDSFSIAEWDRSGQKLSRRTLPERAFGFAATPDGRRVCLRSIHDVEVWELDEGRLLDSYPVSFGSPLVSISPDGERVAYNSVSEVQVRSVGSGGSQTLEVSGASVRALRFLPEGDGLAVGCSDGTVRFWNFE